MTLAGTTLLGGELNLYHRFTDELGFRYQFSTRRRLSFNAPPSSMDHIPLSQ
jgi:hypothetical protein